MNIEHVAKSLEEILRNLFLQNSEVSMFKDIIPIILNSISNEPSSESLLRRIEDSLERVLLECKCSGKDFIVCPKFDLGITDNTIARITDFVYKESVPAIRNIKYGFSFSNESENEKEV